MKIVGDLLDGDNATGFDSREDVDVVRSGDEAGEAVHTLLWNSSVRNGKIHHFPL